MKPQTNGIRQVECTNDGEIVHLSAGEGFFVQFHRHGSVGEDAEFEIGDESIVTHVRTEAEYLHPERMKPGWTGGDAERGRWFFKAIRRGETTITIRILFRFSVESTCTMRMIVE